MLGMGFVKLFVYVFYALLSLGIFVGGIAIAYSFNEESAVWVLIIELAIAVGLGAFWHRKRENEKKLLGGESVKEADNSAGWAGLVLIGSLCMIGFFAEDETAKPQSTTSTPPPSQATSVDLSKYYTATPKTTFYTNAISNVRSCASTACDVVIQASKNASIQLEYSSISSMPEWVPVSWTDDSNTQRSGYMHKTVFSSTPIVPTYSNTYYNSNIHYDDDYKYEYRTGYSGNYNYNYDVEGYGDNGYAYGNIDTSGKYGEGYIYDEDGNEIYVETEWTDYGVMEATDEEGNTYELEVE